MYAVVRTGGKQIRMIPGESVRVEKLAGVVGDSIELDDILLLSNEGGLKVGTPRVDGARVVATITDQARGPKITVFKMKRRKGYRRKQGHRQDYTELLVDRIEV